MSAQNFKTSLEKFSEAAADLQTQAEVFIAQSGDSMASASQVSPFVLGLTVFALAVFVGYYVVWRVTPALHSPLMAVTNAISSVIIVGALIAAGTELMNFSKIMGFIAIILASINIFGGFVITQRMLDMFKKKQ
jgi:proton-translocating NAD(P)+ transhydrogenase subunit alpha